MKKFILAALVIALSFTLVLTGCGIRSCHKCGDPVGNDPISAGGRTYCSYDCYMSEVFFD